MSGRGGGGIGGVLPLRKEREEHRRGSIVSSHISFFPAHLHEAYFHVEVSK